MPNLKTVATFILLLCLTIALVRAVLVATHKITNAAQIATIGLGVYWDVTCTKKCDFIDWGTLMPGESKTVTVYVRNEGGIPITGSFSLSDWVPPEAANYITLQWDFGDLPLQAGRVRETHFTLVVANNIYGIETFYFTITVIGTQYIP